MVRGRISRAALKRGIACCGLFIALGLGTADAQPQTAAAGSSVRVYGGIEYLHWRLQDAPLSVPLISTGPVGSTHHGFLTSPDATILYGAPFAPAAGGRDRQGFGGFSGSRATVGAWLDPAQSLAIEASGFALERRGAGYSAYSDQNGLPIINIPVFNTIPYSPPGRPPGGPPAEDGLPASLSLDPQRFDGNAGVFSGGVRITNTLQLWGADLTGVVVLRRGRTFEVSGLAGLRFLDLSEGLGLAFDSVGQSGAYVGQSGRAFDSFKTNNRFYGGSFGARARYRYGSWAAELTGRVGVGASQETLSVNGGFSSIGFPGGYRTGTEGVFAQPANEGHFSSTRFAVVPEASLKLGWQVTPSLQLTAGYDVLFVTDVIRPGDQINRNIPKGQTFQQAGVPPSTTSPTRLFRSSSFLAQGVSLGASFRF